MNISFWVGVLVGIVIVVLIVFGLIMYAVIKEEEDKLSYYFEIHDDLPPASHSTTG